MSPRHLQGRSVNHQHLHVITAEARTSPLCFEDIYNQFFRYIASLSLRLLGDETDVNDIVQEVFFDCSKKIHKLNDMEHARRWLIQVTIRKTRKLLRRRKIAAFISFSMITPLDPPMPSVSADDLAQLIQLFSVLETVPVNHRLAWSLRYLEGAHLRDVAEACNCSLATAKRWISTTQAVIIGEDND